MRITDQIEAARLSPSLSAAFHRGLEEVVHADGHSNGDEQRALAAMLLRTFPPDTEPAPFEELWPHAELFLTASIYMAVSDGHYGVEEARVISRLAHRLGYSTGQLAALERKVFGELRARAARMRQQA